MTLLDSTGAVVATTTTDANGNYLFTGLVSDSFMVEYTNNTSFVDDSTQPGTL